MAAAGSSWADNGPVFTTSLGTPVEPRNLTRHFYTVRDRAALPEIRFHDLRHTCLTLLLNLGTQPHIAQAIAGDSHIDVTMTIYAHSGMTEHTEALRRLGEAFADSD